MKSFAAASVAFYPTQNDLYRHALQAWEDAALTKVTNLIMVDHHRAAIMEKASLILSATSFLEMEGEKNHNAACY
ncbi:MAG: hypothetical protein ACFC1C_00925 [Candidatus Malihini olakiniferum]